MPGLLNKRDEDLTITRKMADGSSVTYKSPQGSQVDMGGILGGMIQGHAPSPVADNVQINATPGEFVVNQPAAQKYQPLLEKINQEGRVMLEQGGYVDKAKPMGYANGGLVQGPRGGQFKRNPNGGWLMVAGNREFPVQDPSVIEWLENRYSGGCLLYTSPSPRDRQKSRMPSSA